VPAALIGIGAVLIVFTFLLAFTIYGELSAVAGVACIVIDNHVEDYLDQARLRIAA
jgi:hypothetical protein